MRQMKSHRPGRPVRQMAVMTGAWLLALCIGATQARAMTPGECEVWASELAFAESVAAHDEGAFASFLHPDAVFSAATQAPIRGKANIAENWRGIVQGEPLGLRWRPGRVTVGANPNIALSHGPYYLESHHGGAETSYAVGTYTSVWVRSSRRAPWRVLFDRADAAPVEVATLAEAEAHLDSAPSACE
jgi:ketosteroid isomerase-like protein